ncbi:MAG: hypothetical protein U0996_25570 [Planctomycetaceae bacterium]
MKPRPKNFPQQLDEAAQTDESKRLPLVQLAGSDAASKQLLAQHVAAHLGARLLRLPVELIPSDFSELETLMRLWDRESRLLPVALYVGMLMIRTRRPLISPRRRLSILLAQTSGLLMLDTHDLRPTRARILLVDVSKPTATEQRELWQSAE